MPDQPIIGKETVVTHNPQNVFCNLDEEIVLLNIDRGNYYQIDEIGSRIWELIGEPKQVGMLCDELVAEFEVEQETCEADVLAFLHELLNDGLIEVSSDEAARQA